MTTSTNKAHAPKAATNKRKPHPWRTTTGPLTKETRGEQLLPSYRFRMLPR